MTTQEKVKKIRDITMSPFNKINGALDKSNVEKIDFKITCESWE